MTNQMEKTEALRNTERENQEVRLDLQMRHEDEVKSLKVVSSSLILSRRPTGSDESSFETML